MTADDKGNPVVQQLIDRAVSFAKAGRTQEADENFRSAYKQAQVLKLPEGLQTVKIYEGLRDLNLKQKKYDQAIEYAQKITQIDQNRLGSQHILVAEDQKKVADLQFERGKWDEARQAYTDAIATATGAPSSGYGFAAVNVKDPVARAAKVAANQNAKRKLLTYAYDGLTKCFDKLDDITTTEDLYVSTIHQLAQVKDAEVPKNGLRTMVLSRYHAYLDSIQRPDDAIALDTELTELSRRQEANRVYEAPKFRPEGAPIPGR
jgi:tetratricopeptide (TPR) repeat protein